MPYQDKGTQTDSITYWQGAEPMSFQEFVNAATAKVLQNVSREGAIPQPPETPKKAAHDAVNDGRKRRKISGKNNPAKKPDLVSTGENVLDQKITLGFTPTSSSPSKCRISQKTSSPTAGDTPLHSKNQGKLSNVPFLESATSLSSAKNVSEPIPGVETKEKLAHENLARLNSGIDCENTKSPAGQFDRIAEAERILADRIANFRLEHEHSDDKLSSEKEGLKEDIPIVIFKTHTEAKGLCDFCLKESRLWDNYIDKYNKLVHEVGENQLETPPIAFLLRAQNILGCGGAYATHWARFNQWFVESPEEKLLLENMPIVGPDHRCSRGDRCRCLV